MIVFALTALYRFNAYRFNPMTYECESMFHWVGEATTEKFNKIGEAVSFGDVASAAYIIDESSRNLLGFNDPDLPPNALFTCTGEVKVSLDPFAWVHLRDKKEVLKYAEITEMLQMIVPIEYAVERNEEGLYRARVEFQDKELASVLEKVLREIKPDTEAPQ